MDQEALKNYGSVDLNKYVSLIQESLEYLKPRKKTLPDLKTDEKEEKTEQEKPEEDKETKEEKKDSKFEEAENTVLETIRKAEGEDGAPWDVITEKCEKAGLDRDTIEESITSLMDKGLKDGKA